MGSTTFQVALLGRRRIASGTTELSLERPEGFDYRAGQYLQLVVPRPAYPDRLGRSRLLSIVSSPLNRDELLVAYRDSSSGFKRSLGALDLGDMLGVQGPHGFFTLPDRDEDRLVFVAGGIGITAFTAMLGYGAETGYQGPITVLYANTSEQRAAYRDELERLAGASRSLTVEMTCGRIDARLVERSVPDPARCVWYVAGPPAMVAAVRNMLFGLGVDDDQLRLEEFAGY